MRNEALFDYNRRKTGPVLRRFFLGQETFDKIIAVDAGLEAVKALGLEPDMIVGDFDTVKPEVLAYYRRMEHIVWDTHQPEKDETDTELALLKAQATGCTEVVVLGATGGRMDHMLGNIHLLFPCLQKGMEHISWTARTVSTSLTGNGPLRGMRLGKLYFLPAAYPGGQRHYSHRL